MNLNIREFPNELHERIKRRAAFEGKSLAGCCVDLLDEALQIKTDGKVDHAYEVTCPVCGLSGPPVRFGANARCFHCGVGFIAPEEMKNER